MTGERIRSRGGGRAADWVLALSLAVFGAIRPVHDGLHGEGALLFALDLCATLPLVVRRRRPLSVLTVVVAVTDKQPRRRSQ